MRNIRNKY